MIMLRADIDALPIQEQNDLPFRSQHPGIMHACGHDVHISCLLGAAAIIQRYRKHLKGEVRFIFQPGEEKLPGGASIMIEEGLFKDGHPSSMIALHVHPPLEAGHVGFYNGLYMASSDELYITVIGKGGHAATPHLTIDPIVMAAKVVTSLQELISRTKDPIMPGVLTIGKIYSDGGATNVIPDKVFLEGTLRAMDEKWRMDTHIRLPQMVKAICEASGGKAEVRIEKGYPSLYNHPEVTDYCRDAAKRFLGEEKVHPLPQRMSSEDFAYYSQIIPTTFFRLGTGWTDPDKNHPVHTSRFEVNEAAIETGMGLMAYFALSSGELQS
jgi:amidohydrolase